MALAETSGVTVLRAASGRKLEEAKNDDAYIAGKLGIHADQFEDEPPSREMRTLTGFWESFDVKFKEALRQSQPIHYERNHVERPATHVCMECLISPVGLEDLVCTIVTSTTPTRHHTASLFPTVLLNAC